MGCLARCGGVVVCLMASIVPAAGAPARDGQGTRREPDLTAYRRLGPFFYSPSLAVRAFGYDGNVFLDGEEPRGDLMATLGPELRGVVRMGRRFWADARGSVDYTGYRRYTSINHFDSRRGAGFTGWISDLRLAAAWDQDHVLNRPSSEVDVRVRRDVKTARASAMYELTPDTSLEAGLARTDDRAGRAEGVDYDPLLGHTDTAVSFTGRHRVGPATVAVLAWSGVRQAGHGEAGFRDLERSEALAGFDFERGALLEGSVRLGMASVRTPDRPVSSRQESRVATGRGDLEVKAGTRSRVKVAFGRDFVPSTYLDNIWFRHDRVELAWLRELTARLAGEVGGARGWIAYPELEPEARRDAIVELFGGLRARLGNQAELRIRAGLWTRDSSLPDEDRRRFVLQQSVTFPL